MASNISPVNSTTFYESFNDPIDRNSSTNYEEMYSGSESSSPRNSIEASNSKTKPFLDLATFKDKPFEICLKIAIQLEQPGVLKELLERRKPISGFDINALCLTDEDGIRNNLLHFAAALFPDKQIFEFLLDHGADIHAKNSVGKTPVDYSPYLETLANAKSTPKKRYDVFPKSKYRGSLSSNHTTEELLDSHRTNTFLPKETLLIYVKNALTNKNWSELDSLLEKNKQSGLDINAPIDEFGNTLLHFATKMDNPDVLQILINHGANLRTRNSEDFTALGLALEDENSKAAIFLEKTYKKHLELNQHDKNMSGSLPDHISDHSVSKSMQNLEMTPLHLAIEAEDEKETLRIIDLDPLSVFAKTPEGFSPLHFACIKGNRALIEILLKRDADANDKNNDGKTPLHFAVIYRHVNIIALFENRADFNIQDNEEMTPLHYAADLSEGNIAKLLMRYGAKMTVKNKRRQTPLHVRDIDFFISPGIKTESVLFNEKNFQATDYFARTLIGGFFYGSFVRTISISCESLQNRFTEVPGHIDQLFFVSAFSLWIATSSTINTLLRVRRGYVPSIKRRIISEALTGAIVLSTAYLSGNLATIGEIGRTMIELYTTELCVKKVIFPVTSFCIKFWKRNYQTHAPLLLDEQTSAPLLIDGRETAAILRKKLKEGMKN